ncbi:MAG: multidrug ABC transporter ATP-binding protein [Hyperthermus sp.]|nr:MAG: multidrug ABC transporter ATP-binding protein [Hyperthermus sp.]
MHKFDPSRPPLSPSWLEDKWAVDVIVSVKELVKTYPGGTVALRGVSLKVYRGEVYGLVGPNGAGKTTAFRIIATLLKPTRGSVVVDGVDVVSDPLEARKRIAYVPEEVGGYRRLTGLEYIRFIVSSFLSASGREELVDSVVEEAAELTGLSMSVLSGKRMGEYSKGMKRRVQVAWALAVKPRLAILDEPTTGLDVEASYELRELIRDYARSRGVTVMLSSHNMFEVETVCDRVGLIRGGVLMEEGRPAEIVERFNARSLEDAYMRILASRGRSSPQ